MREKRLHRMNDGTNAGRSCWVVAGTLCGDGIKASGTYAQKVGTCIECDFYGKVKAEEGAKLKRPLELLKMLN